MGVGQNLEPWDLPGGWTSLISFGGRVSRARGRAYSATRGPGLKVFAVSDILRPNDLLKPLM